jgi:hypothetical protein
VGAWVAAGGAEAVGVQHCNERQHQDVAWVRDFCTVCYIPPHQVAS